MTTWNCDSCGTEVALEAAYAPMETLELLCRDCLREKLQPCSSCGARILASAYQHLPTSEVLCEPCAVKRIGVGPRMPPAP